MITISIPNRTYPAGNLPITELGVPTGISLAQLLIDRTNWTNPAVILTTALELSYDNGVTWVGGGGGQAPGGVLLDKNGNVRTVTEFRWTWPDPDNPLRRIRGTINIAGGNLKTGATLNLMTAAEAATL